jgi:hypothetical protein
MIVGASLSTWPKVARSREGRAVLSIVVAMQDTTLVPDPEVRYIIHPSFRATWR